MSTQSDALLRDYIETVSKIDYFDEKVQKSIIIAHDMGASISLYDYIHKDDPREGDIDIDGFLMDGYSAWIQEFRKAILDGLNG